MSSTTEITFQTADQSGAGTDSNIFVIFKGLSGNSREYRMQNFTDKNGHSDLFERGDDNKFVITHSEPLGMIYSVEVRSDGKYSGSDWRLASIYVKHSENNKVVTSTRAAVNTWLDEGGISVSLSVPHARVTATGESVSKPFRGTPLSFSNATSREETIEFSYTDALNVVLSSSEENHFDETTGINFGAEFGVSKTDEAGGSAEGAKATTSSTKSGKFSAGISNSIRQGIQSKTNLTIGQSKTQSIKQNIVLPPMTKRIYTPKYNAVSEVMIVSVGQSSFNVSVPTHLDFAGEDIEEAAI